MALIWVILFERNNTIFNHKATSITNMLDSILYFVNFWADNLSGSLKRKVDPSLLNYARKRMCCNQCNVSAAGSAVAGGSIAGNFPIAGVLDVGHSSGGGSAIPTGSMIIVRPRSVVSDVSPIVGDGNDAAGNY